MKSSLSPKTFHFLSDLEKNNNREWFAQNKDRYIDAKEDTVDLLESLIAEIGQFDEKILKTEPKKAIFRIYRDIRFSKDKSPYKTNIGASLGMAKGSQKAGYYLHIEPQKSFLAAGIYMPETNALKAIRKEISVFSEDFLTIIQSSGFKKYFGDLSRENMLKKIPQGFEKEDPMGEYLKLKNFIVVYQLKDEDLVEKYAAKKFSEIYKTVKPLNDFLNRALE